ncbi:hypothetical protein BUE93_04510 [Chromobacterium amazonense]|uniref:STAS domain-containing protein n=1 Tax=Chromobacterium amazonense TaxID=1382803 RepID=A0A2S9X864_9NEIS|nr:STAS domain-containing protein [Chromobacterium amazonense]PRP71909.1 hypothetical protein BUE93_04510 [Chromobacterium amazonense]
MTLSLVAGHEQTIYQAAQWRADLEQALRSEEDIVLDLSTIEALDCAGAQVLIWLRREAERRGRKVDLRDPSRCVREFALLMGLQRELLPAADNEETGDGS